MLRDIGSNFGNMATYDRVSCIKAFARVGLNLVDFYEKNIEYIL